MKSDLLLPVLQSMCEKQMQTRKRTFSSWKKWKAVMMKWRVMVHLWIVTKLLTKSRQHFQYLQKPILNWSYFASIVVTLAGFYLMYNECKKTHEDCPNCTFMQAALVFTIQAGFFLTVVCIWLEYDWKCPLLLIRNVW